MTTTDSGSNSNYGEEKEDDAQEEEDSILEDEDESDLEVEYQDVFANFPDIRSVRAIFSTLLVRLMPQQQRLGMIHARDCHDQHLQNAAHCGTKPAGQTWLMKLWNVSVNCSSCDPIRPAGTHCSLL